MLANSQKKFIKKHYKTMRTCDIAKKLNLSSLEVSTFAGNCKLYKSHEAFYSPRKLCQEKQNLIFKNYATGDLNELCKKTNQSLHALQAWANKNGLKRQVNNNRKGNLSPFFNKTLESFYWLGFVAADGYIYKNGHFMVSQAKKDKHILENLAIFLNTYVRKIKHKKNKFSPKDTIMYRVNICDKIIGKKLRKIFGIIDKPKTYTGVSLKFIKTNKQALAFLCGFIDGDGTFGIKSRSYRIQCHKSWEKTFIELAKKTPIKMTMSVKRSPSKKYKYLNIYIGKNDSIKLRSFIEKNKIPASDRKFPINEDE